MFYLRYLAAFVYDAVIILALCFLFTAICIVFADGQTIPPATRWYQAALCALTYFYYFLSYRFGGQTIGMRAWRIRLLSLRKRLLHRQVIGRILFFIPACCYAIFYMKNPFQINERWTKTQLINLNSKVESI